LPSGFGGSSLAALSLQIVNQGPRMLFELVDSRTFAELADL
jgi:hypothetical protein